MSVFSRLILYEGQFAFLVHFLEDSDKLASCLIDFIFLGGGKEGDFLVEKGAGAF